MRKRRDDVIAVAQVNEGKITPEWIQTDPVGGFSRMHHRDQTIVARCGGFF